MAPLYILKTTEVNIVGLQTVFTETNHTMGIQKHLYFDLSDFEGPVIGQLQSNGL